MIDEPTRDLLRRIATLEGKLETLEKTPAIPLVDALPAAGNLGRLVVLSTDAKLYRDTGAAWKSSDQV